MSVENSAEDLIRILTVKIKICQNYIDENKADIECCNDMIAELRSELGSLRNDYVQSIMSEKVSYNDDIAKHESPLSWRKKDIQRLYRRIDELKDDIESNKSDIKLFQEAIEELKNGEKSTKSIYCELINKVYVFYKQI